jgi:hypothetical protein
MSNSNEIFEGTPSQYNYSDDEKSRIDSATGSGDSFTTATMLQERMSNNTKTIEGTPSQYGCYDEENSQSVSTTASGEPVSAAALLHERLTVLTECWECKLLFNELPPQHRQLLLLTEPNSPLLNQTVDLCEYMDRKCCARDRIQTDFPANTVYRFPSCYKGLESHALLHKQLLIAAESSNFSICLRNSKKEKRKMLFVCKHARLYDERFGKNKPNAVLPKRSTYTHRSLQKSSLCPFSFTVFHCLNDDFWYLSNYAKRSMTNKGDKVNMHRYHPRLHQDHITPSLKSMDITSLGMYQKYFCCNV